MLKKRFSLIIALTIVIPLVLLVITILGLNSQKKLLDQIAAIHFKNYQSYADINSHLLRANSAVYKIINQIHAGKSEKDLVFDMKKAQEDLSNAIKLSKEIFERSHDDKDNKANLLISEYQKEQDGALPSIMVDVSVGAMMMMTVENKFRAALDVVSERLQFLKNEVDTNVVRSDEKSSQTIMLVIISSLILLGVSIGVIVIVSSRLIGMLNTISNELISSSTETTGTSQSLSEASATLSSTVQEQAAAINETTASLEEIDGILKANLETVEKTNEMSLLMREESAKAQNGMSDLETSMQSILQSNEEIKKLVDIIGNIAQKTKVMDEIVFQTKLLSFNASVEAERAGEHGRGFAVVAQEVGNLASMSGAAAKEISDILKASLANAKEITKSNQEKVLNGNDIVKMTASVLGNITSSSVTLADNAQQVLEASREQQKGVAQINLAMVELEKSTHQNSSLAEQSAANSQQLADQATAVQSVVANLKVLISG